LLGAGVIGMRWYRIRQFALAQAAECDRLERSYLSMAANFENAFAVSRKEMARIARSNQVEPIFDSLKEPWAKELREDLEGCRKAADQQAAMRRRFLRVATFPWLPLPAYDPFSHTLLSPRERRAMNQLFHTPGDWPPE